VTILLVHPGVIGFKANVPFEIRGHRNAALVPWLLEVGILESIVEADRAGILQLAAK
jgi:hypothetical protein